jgi:hypothetical protein
MSAFANRVGLLVERSKRTRTRWVARCDDFFFRTERVDRAVYFRIFLAAWTALFFVPRLPYLAELYTARGLHVRHPIFRYFGVVELPLWGAWIVVLFLLACLLGFAVGFHARKLHLLVLLLLSYLFGYDFSSVRGYGQLAFFQWIVAFWLPYDRWRDDKGEVRRAARWALRLVTLLFSSVYAFAVLAKTVSGEGWLDGRTPYYTFHGRDYGNTLLSAWLPLSLEMAKVLGWCTLASEAFVAVGLWHRRTRTAAMLVCLGMHATMAVTLRVSILFHLLMIGHLPLFFSESTWERMTRRLQRPSPNPTVSESPADA